MNPVSHEDLMRYLDGEATPEERAIIDSRIESSSELRREMAIFHAMKEDLQDLSFVPHGGVSTWDRIRTRITKPVGWTLTAIGSVTWVGYGIWVFMTSTTGVGAKLATGAIAIGILVLLADVIFERYKDYGTDPYRDVHR
ncbi:MAG: anti-sigma factor family protein [Longimicrobiales bacterium]